MFSTNPRKPSQMDQCFSGNYQRTLTTQWKTRFSNNAVHTGMSDTNIVVWSTANGRPIVHYSIPMTCHAKKMENLGNESHTSIIKNPLKKLEKIIEEELRTPMK